MTYGQNYFNILKGKIDATNVPSDSMYMLDKMNILELSDADTALANTDFNNIYLPSMNKIMGLLEKSSAEDIQDMELIVAKQQQIMESIVDHETAHSLEYIHKRIGMQIYNERLLPKLIDGSLGVVDEKSFEKNRQKLRDLMSEEFVKTYKPNEYDLTNFNNFVNEYYIPDGPFGLTNRIADIDNYISDIYIENDFINVLQGDKLGTDKKFQYLRNLLYENSNPEEEFSILKSIQIYIDPRFEDSKILDKVKSSKKFDEFLNIDISDLNLDPSLFKLTSPDDFQQLKMIVIMKELKEIMKKLRGYSYLTAGDYIKYKEEYKVDSSAASLLSSKLAKVIYIKELQNENDKEKVIQEIVKNDKYMSFNLDHSNKSNNTDSSDENDKNSVLKELPKIEFEDTLQKIGHNNDYGDELLIFINENIASIERHLESNIIQQQLNSNNINSNEKDIISGIIKKPITSDFFHLDNSLELTRLTLFHEITSSVEYKKLEDLVEEFKSQIGNVEFKNNSAGIMNNIVDDYINGNEFLYSMNGNQKVNTFIHCFIDDSMSMKNKKIDNKYTVMDYQIVNTMIMIDLFKDIEGVDILVSNFPRSTDSMNLLYDSTKDNNINIIALDATKNGSPIYQSVVETNVKIKTLDLDKDIINVFMSDGDDNMNPKDFAINGEFFNNIVKDSHFIQFSGNEINNISNSFEDRYVIIENKEDITKGLINTFEKIVENLEHKLEFDNSIDKNYDLDKESNKKI